MVPRCDVHGVFASVGEACRDQRTRWKSSVLVTACVARVQLGDTYKGAGTQSWGPECQLLWRCFHKLYVYCMS